MSGEAQDFAAALRKLFPSDSLPSFRALLGQDLRVRKLLRIREPVPVVVDTSQAVHDVLWLAKTRRTEARTDLQEAIDSEVVAAYAPRQLESEMEAKIPILAQEKKIPESKLRDAWSDIRRRLKFSKVTPRPRKRPVRDATDLAFVDLSRRKKAAGVVTHDNDFTELGVRVVSKDIMRKLRDYGRASSVRLGAEFVFMILCAVVGGLLWFIVLRPLVKLFGWLFERLGAWFLVIILGIGAAFALAYWLNEGFRERVKARAKRIGDFFSSGWAAVAPHLEDAAVKVAEESLKEKELWGEIEAELKLLPTSNPMAPALAGSDAPPLKLPNVSWPFKRD